MITPEPPVVKPPNPVPDTGTADERGQPRVQYSRTYVLLPPSATPDLLQRATLRFFDERCTVGFSADDAGIGDLNERVVIAVDPEGWGGDLRAWFEQYYPGVRYRVLGSSEL